MPTAANIAKTAVADLLHAHVIVMLDQAKRIADITRLLVRILTPYTELQGSRNQNALHGFEYELTVRLSSDAAYLSAHSFCDECESCYPCRD